MRARSAYGHENKQIVHNVFNFNYNDFNNILSKNIYNQLHSEMNKYVCDNLLYFSMMRNNVHINLKNRKSH